MSIGLNEYVRRLPERNCHGYRLIWRIEIEPGLYYQVWCRVINRENTSWEGNGSSYDEWYGRSADIREALQLTLNQLGISHEDLA